MKNRFVALIVDNEPLIADVIEAMLQEVVPDIKVVYADSDEEAWRKLEAFSPAFIAIDLKVPNGGGLKLAQALRANPVTAKIPLIGMTTLYPLEEEGKRFEALCDYFLTKPFTFTQLEKIAKALVPA